MFDTYSADLRAARAKSSIGIGSKPYPTYKTLVFGWRDNARQYWEAIKKIHPPMVDVCSGVEKSPTRKDYEQMKTFIQKAKA